ncbi:peroxiredoxin family protein [Oceanisphaera sp.]|uniref:peroxiredoxin family protein n=1 Tax=Oceanisphaera sp. TaxID=1929979 RepID=UPI003A955DAA
MKTQNINTPAIELNTSTWLNSDRPIKLNELIGRVVVLHTFQMLCPGCVLHGLPQAIKVRNSFSEADVVVLGLHTVFEHHSVMGKEALQVFLHEYNIHFPVGIDQAAAGSDIPLTMQAYGLRGTPSIILIDRKGQVRLNYFGVIDDMLLGAHIGQLMAE